MRTPLPLIVLFCTGVGIVAAQSSDPTLAVIPRPVQMTRGGSAFVLTAGTVIVTDRATRDIGYQLADWLAPATGPAIGGFLPLDSVYTFEPVPPSLDSTQAAHILGIQGQIWTEYQSTPKNVEYMVFPRLAALAEVAWTPREQKNFGDFRARLERHLERLGILDVNYRPLTTQ